MKALSVSFGVVSTVFIVAPMIQILKLLWTGRDAGVASLHNSNIAFGLMTFPFGFLLSSRTDGLISHLFCLVPSFVVIKSLIISYLFLWFGCYQFGFALLEILGRLIHRENSTGAWNIRC